MGRLRIVRGADDVAFQLFFENPGIAFLHPRRHRLSNKWKHLVAVEAAEFQMLAVEIKTFGREFGLAESDAGFVVVVTKVCERYANVVEFRLIDFPKLN